MTTTLSLIATDADTPADRAQVPALPVRVRAIIDEIKSLVTEQPTALIQPYSGGKDSTVVVSLATAALRELAEEGRLPAGIRHLVLSADTGVENPLVRQLMQSQHAALNGYADAHGLPLATQVTRAPLSSSFQVSILGGRRIMPKFGMNSGCSVDWKVQPCQQAVKAHLASLPSGVRAVTLLGSRRDEGQKRSANMDKQGASGMQVVFHDGQYMVYPIMDFTAEDVFNYLLLAGPSGPFPTFRQDQGDVLRLYSNSSAGCALLATDQTAGALQTCSARTGCVTCLVNGDEDGSLQSLVNTVAPHLQPLVDFRRFLRDVSLRSQYRNFMGTQRDREGKVNLGAKGYAGWVLLAMVRFLLSADANEAERAAAAGESPAFQMLGIQEILAIDYWWSLRGLQHQPFEALRAWKEVHEMGVRFSLPTLNAAPDLLPRIAPIQLPALDYLLTDSLASPIHSMHEVSFGYAERLSVDLESAILFTELMADALLNDTTLAPQAAARTLVSLGIVMPCQSQRETIDARLAVVAHLRDIGWLEHAYKGGLPEAALSLGVAATTVMQPDLFAA